MPFFRVWPIPVMKPLIMLVSEGTGGVEGVARDFMGGSREEVKVTGGGKIVAVV